MRILVVDLSNVFWTIANSGSSSEGTAARDFSLRDIRESAVTHDRVVIAVDGNDTLRDWPQIPWRRSIWPSYKANREERAQSHWALLKDTIAHCEAEGWIVFRSPPMLEPNPDDDGRTDRLVGYHEADDVIGSMARWCRENGHELSIRSGDSDLAVCVRDDEPQIRMLRKHKGQRFALDCAAVLEWQGVPAHAISSMKAIAGDVGDGYGGKNGPYPGIGWETAKELLRAASGNPVEAIERCIADDRKNKDGKTIPSEIKTCRALGTGPVKTALRLARLDTKLALDFDRIAATPLAKAPPSLPSAPAEVALSDDDRREIEFVGEQVIQDREARRGTSTAMVVSEPPRMQLAPRELEQRDREISALVKYALKNGPPDGVSDYGIIPGCGNKPALFDVGAERLAKTFAIYPKYKIIDKIMRLDTDAPFVFYQVRCRLFLIGSNNQVGESIATCNSGEKTFVTQRKPITDLINPVYTRAQKRAFVRAVLRATGAQKYLSSGFEDLVDAEFGAYPDAPQWETRQS
jgi:5'-3' exonuclease